MSEAPREVTVRLALDDSDDDDVIARQLARKLGVQAEDLDPWVIRRRAIDARHGKVAVELIIGFDERALDPSGPPLRDSDPSGPHVVIVGTGPAGLFCAWGLARMGIRSTLVDRGKKVQPRRHDLAGMQKRGEVDPDSNYCFGEGGAGTYSDGKLYTRSHKRGSVRDVLEVLAACGAPPAILTDARPHIGSNKLPKVVTQMREQLEAHGAVFRFETRVVGLDVTGSGSSRRAQGVRLANGETIGADAVVVAAGHSARDVQQLWIDAGTVVEPKPFAVGFRIEHPQPLIDRIQYGRFAKHPKLRAASYRLAHTEQGRGVFSFCMCPGGWIVPSSTEPGTVVVNGMSLSRRDSPYANAGLVASVDVADAERAVGEGVLSGVGLQRRIEEAAFQAGGGRLVAPATRVTDFLASRASTVVGSSSYLPGLHATNVADVLDASGLPLTESIRTALQAFAKKMKGFVTEEAVLVGVESRTSSPIRIARDGDTLEAPGFRGLFPAGEGAGHAGGIVSAALDGLRIAEAIATHSNRGAARD